MKTFATMLFLGRFYHIWGIHYMFFPVHVTVFVIVDLETGCIIVIIRLKVLLRVF